MSEKQLLAEKLALLPTARVLCIGDIMLDRYCYGAVDRVSPEAPIPVLLMEREKSMLGGVGNVVANLRDLGAVVSVLAVAGQDEAANDISRALADLGVGAEHIVSEKGRATTQKTRFVAGTQQMLRVDHEKAVAVTEQTENMLIEKFKTLVADVACVVVSDYGKGVCTDRVLKEIIAIARQTKTPVVVDPKGSNYKKYSGATVVTPNRKELELAAGQDAGDNDAVRAAAMKVLLESDIHAVLATRSKDGMALVSKDQPPVYIAANVRDVFDVSGAGDTVVSTLSAGLAAGLDMVDAAELANVAAGIVVGKIGTATVRVDEIRDVLLKEEDHAITFDRKIGTAKEISEKADLWRARGLKVGFTNGCYDLLHKGHLSSFRQAKQHCDRLVVAINSDESVKKLKGPTRPIQDEETRSEILAALDCVDAVIIFGEDTPIELIKSIKPDVLVKGGQYKLEEVVGYDVVAAYGGTVVRAEMEEGYSTTNTVERIVADKKAV